MNNRKRHQQAAREDGSISKERQGFFELDNKLTLQNIAIVALALAYVVGYLIYSIGSNKVSLSSETFLKSEYLEIGMIFILFSSSLVLIPTCALGLTKKIMKKKSDILILGNLFVITNFCYVLLTLTLFLIGADWGTELNLFGNRYPFLFLLNVYIYSIVGLRHCQLFCVNLIKGQIRPHLSYRVCSPAQLHF